MPQSQLPDSPEATPSETSLAETSLAETSLAETSFGDLLSEFEQSHHSRGETVEGTVVSVTPEAVFVDIGRKMDGVITPDAKHVYKKGDKVLVSIRGR